MLVFAVKKMKPEHTVLEHKDLDGSLTLLGIVGMIDPPRSESIAAVAECHHAGIQVKMITGDQRETATFARGIRSADGYAPGAASPWSTGASSAR